MFKFSIVMAVYNVEQFLSEAIESVLRQDIDFKDNVQLILVDDGSTDSSGTICDEYAEKFPENILVIHKENGGVSSARNEGLKHIEGEYINFLDADDKLENNALKEVEKFFIQHKNSIDMVSIPIKFFDAQQGNHVLNYKFNKGTRVIDLTEEYDCIQLHIASTFIKTTSMRNIKFDERLKYAEDAKLCIQLLANKKKLGVINYTAYLYRKRSVGEDSALDKSLYEKVWYLDSLKYFTKDIVDFYDQNNKIIPKFIQYTLMYDLQWKIKIRQKIANSVLDIGEWNEFKSIIAEVLRFIDDDIILKQKHLYIEHKCFLIAIKHKTNPYVIIKDNMASYYVNDTFIHTINDRSVNLEFMNMINNRIEVEGYITYFKGITNSNVKIAAIINHEIIPVKITNGRQIQSEILGENTVDTINFKFTLNNLEKECTIQFVTVIDNTIIEHRTIRTKKFFPINYVNPFSYIAAKQYIYSLEGNKLIIAQNTFLKHAYKEYNCLKWLLFSKKAGTTKAFFLRLAYHFLKPIMNKDIWLVSDRINKADDNGEAFFKFLHDNKIKQKRYFVISKNSPDYINIKKYGSVLNHYSLKHRIIHLFAKKIISSAGDDYVFCPFWNSALYFRDLMYGQKRIFLQHGITKDDISGWLNKYNKNFDIFITAAKPEYQSIIKGKYYYDESIVKLSGFARYDRLVDNKEKIITIMPTWRSYLVRGSNYHRNGADIYDDSFLKSEYFQFYNKLINNEKLLKTLKEYDYILKFMPHPRVIPYINVFDIKEGVKFCSLDDKYRDIFAESSLLVTDYSSVAFDFAYLKKPVVYCQFDKASFFSHHTYQEGYFNYEENGFGEVEYTLEATVNRIIEYIQHECTLKEKYRERTEKFFAYHDTNNCQRIYDAIMAMEK